MGSPSTSSSSRIMPVKKSSASSSSTASIVLGVPLSIHMGQFVVIALVMVGLRFDFFAHFVQSILSILPSGGIAVKYAAPWFKPLSVQDWFVHATTLIPNLETIEWFRKRRAAVSQSKNETNKNNTLYQSLHYLFIMSHVQGIFALLSHSLIGVRDDLQLLFFEWDNFFMRLHVFSTGLLIFLPGPVVSWNVIVSVVLPLLAYLVNQDILTFQSVPGIVLSTLSMIAILTTPSTRRGSGDDDEISYLPLLFKLGWVLLAFMPVLFPDTSNDWGHTLGAGLLNVPLFVMAYGLLKSSSSDPK
jgi:hypothetical protein